MVKAVGLAAGKGVVVAHTEAEAAAAVDDMLVERKFGEAGECCPLSAALGTLASRRGDEVIAPPGSILGNQRMCRSRSSSSWSLDLERQTARYSLEVCTDVLAARGARHAP